MICNWFKTKYKHYANEYKQRIVNKVINEKKKIHMILHPYVEEKGICKMITDYLPYKRNERHYNFEKIDIWNEYTFVYNELSNKPDIMNVLILFIKKERYLNKTRLDTYLSALSFLFNMIYLDEDGIHIFYTLLRELEKHSTFKMSHNCQTIQDFQVFLNSVDNPDIFQSFSYYIYKRMQEDHTRQNKYLQIMSFDENLYEKEKDYEIYNECGCVATCQCDCIDNACKCSCKWSRQE